MGFEVERRELPMLGGDEDDGREGSDGGDGSETSGAVSGDEKENDGMEGLSSP